MKHTKLVVGTLVVLAAIAFTLLPTIIHDEQVTPKQQQKDELKKDIKKAPEIQQKNDFDRWLDRLAEYECPHCGPHYRRLDANDLFSYGCLQFQEATWLLMGKRFGYLEAGIEEIDDRIYDCALQKRIATAMFASDGTAAARNWYTSIYVKGLGLPA